MNEQQNSGEAERVEPQPFTPQKEKHVGMAVVAYLLFFVPLLTDAKDDPFVKYHVKQGLVLFIAAMAVNILSMTMIPLMVIAWVLQLGEIVLVIIGIMNALHGKKEPLPLIGQFAEHFKF